MTQWLYFEYVKDNNVIKARLMDQKKAAYNPTPSKDLYWYTLCKINIFLSKFL